MKILTAGRKSGFTLIEMMLVVVIAAILATMGMVKYRESLSRHVETQGITYLKMIHTANVLYRSKTGAYWAPGGTVSISSINSALGTQIPDDTPFSFGYTAGGGGATFTATAAPTGYGYTIRATENTLTSTNPCCSVSTCPSLPAC